MKSQFHYDYPRLILLLFIGFMAYSAGTISGGLIAFVFLVWTGLIILCGVLRVLKRMFGKEPKVY